jgi:hypothetical protein
MKKKVGELYDKPIVIGNPNEFNKNEIALSDLGGDSVDDGMLYFKLENPSIRGGNSGYCISCIAENEVGDRVLINNPAGRKCIAIQVSNKIVSVDEPNKTILDLLIEDAFNYDLDFLNEPTIKQITAKEYYSLIKN